MTNVQRWYAGFRYRGNVKQLVDKISEKVLEHDLSEFVPLVRIEKGAKPKGFYFFIAVETVQPGDLPESVQSYLMPLPFFKSPIKGKPSFSYDEIKPMVGAAHDVHDYTNPIPYKIVESDRNDDPFQIIPTSTEQKIPDIEAISQRYQQLLYWLSATGNGTWELFKKACQALEIETPGRILRRLKLLGHIESSVDGRRWSAAPTSLVQIESQSETEKFILCGQQTGHLLSILEQYAQVNVIHHSRGHAPDGLQIQLTDSTQINPIIEQVKTSLGLSIQNRGNVANQLAEILPELKEWTLRLRSLPGIVPSLYHWKRFESDDFTECVFSQQTGLYQMWDLDGGDRSRLTLFYDAATNSWRQGDWYGLRFLALQHREQPCIARYDRVKARLAIPYSQRWPQLYERALVLASGQLPNYQKTEQSLWLIYENVGRELVQQLTQKLQVTWEEDEVTTNA